MSSISDLYRSFCRPLAAQPTETVPRLERLTAIEAVVFDIYGTLVISGVGDIGHSSEERSLGHFREALAAAGWSDNGLSEEDAVLLQQEIQSDHARTKQQGTEYPEVEIREIWQNVVGTLESRDVVERHTAATREDFERLAVEYELRTNPVWPMPGTADLLRTLRDRRLPLGIVSNAQFYTPIMLEALCGASLEELGFVDTWRIWSYEHREGKPSTRLYERLIERMQATGVQPEQVLYVGNDMLKDIAPAQLCGLKTALFAGDARSLRMRDGDPRVEGVTPDLVLTSLDQILECLA